MAQLCTRCGREARDDDAFCARCGHPLTGPPFGAGAAATAAWPAEPAARSPTPAAAGTPASPTGLLAAGTAVGAPAASSVAREAAPGSTRLVCIAGAPYALAGFGRRLAALAIDLLVVVVIGLVVGTVLGVAVAVDELRRPGDLSEAELQQRLEARVESPAAANGISAAWATLAGAYLLGGHMLGVSFGAKAVGLRVLRSDGRRPGVRRGLARWLGSWLSALALGLGYLSSLWDNERRTWHDRLAGTRVVRR